MNEDELKKYHDIITAAWKFFKTHINMDGSEEWYKHMTEDARRQIEDFGQTDHDFATSIFAAVCSAVQRNEIERRGKRDGDQGSVPE